MNRQAIQLCVLFLLCEPVGSTRREDAKDVCHRHTYHKWLFFLTTPSTAICYSENHGTDCTYLRHLTTVSTDVVHKHEMPSASVRSRRAYPVPKPRKKLKGSKNQRKKQKKKRRAFKSKRKGKQKV